MVTATYSTMEKGTEKEQGFAFADSPVNFEIANPAYRAVFAQGVPMQAWEYCIFEIKSMHSDQDRAERVEELNKLGAAGWEPAGTTSGGSQFHEYLIFKRPRF